MPSIRRKIALQVVVSNLSTVVDSALAADVGLFGRATSAVHMVGKVIAPSIHHFTLPYVVRIHHITGHVSAHFVRVSFHSQQRLAARAGVGVRMAHDIVPLLFGEQWLAAVPLAPWLCAAIAIAIATLFKLIFHTVTGLGKPFWHSLFYAKIIWFCISLKTTYQHVFRQEFYKSSLNHRKV